MQKNNSTLIIIVLLLAIIAVLGFFTFNKSGTQQDAASIKAGTSENGVSNKLNEYINNEFAKTGIKTVANVQPMKNSEDLVKIFSSIGIKKYGSLSEAIIANQNNQSNEKPVHVADTCYFSTFGNWYAGGSYPPGTTGNSFGGDPVFGWFCFEVWI
jgi:predicted negative regulator of RcsB-dependent stress response